MKLGIFSDAHGNIEAIRLCYYAMKKFGPEKFFFLGDAIGYYPFGNEVLDFLQEKEIEMIKGNHEAMFLGEHSYNIDKEPVYQLKRLSTLISASTQSYLRKLKSHKTLKIDNCTISFFHGSPSDSLTGYLYPDSDFSDIELRNEDFIFVGHTHIPFIKRVNDTTVVNVGSCGMSRDVGSLLSFCIFDTISFEVDIYRLPLSTDFKKNINIQKTHASVIALLDRKADKYFGKIIN